MAVFQVGPKNWGFRTYLGYDPRTGKRITHQKSGFRTKREAQKAENEMKGNAQRGIKVDRNQMFGDYLLEYLETYKKGRPSYETEKWYAEKYIIPHLGKIKLQAISADHIQKFYRAMLDGGAIAKKTSDGKPKGLAPRTVSRMHSIISHALNTAAKTKRIPHSPMNEVIPPRIPRPNPKGWDDEEAAAFLAEAKRQNNRYYTLFLLAISTGARPGEILGLKWENVNLRKGYIIIDKGLKKAGPDSETGEVKTDGSRRMIYIHPNVVEELRKHRWRQQEEARNSKIKPFNPEGYVFVNRAGNPVPIDNLRNRDMKRIAEAAGVRPLSPHGLRHTFATIALIRNVNPRLVAEVTGHSTVKTLLDIYSRVTPSVSSAAAFAVNDALEEAEEEINDENDDNDDGDFVAI